MGKEEPRNNIAAFGRNCMTVQDENLVKARKKVNDIIVQENFTSEDEDGLFDILEYLENYLDGKNTSISFSASELALLQKYEVDGFFSDNGDGKDAIKEILISEPSQEDIGLDTEENKHVEPALSRLEEIESMLEQGLADTDFESLIDELEKRDDRGGSLLPKLKIAESKRFEALTQKIDSFIKDKEYDKAKKSLEMLKELRGESPQIKEFEKIIAEQSNQVTETREISEAKSLLKRHDDYHSLLEGLDLARKILKGMDDNDASVADLRILFADAEKMRREISATLDAAQTMGAMKQYQGQVRNYAALLDRGVFLVEVPDDKSKKVKVADLHREALENLREAQEETVKNRCGKAKDIQNTDPELAWMYLEELSGFIGEYKGRDLYNIYTDVRVKVERSLKSWKQADRHVKEAVGVSPRERLAKYRKAGVAFKAYQDLDNKIYEAKGEVRAEIARAANLKIKQQKLLLNIDSVKIPFAEIESTLKDVREAIHEIGKLEGDLVDVQRELETVETLARRYKRRHLAIKEVAKLLQEELDKENPDATLLQETLNSLGEEDKKHALLRAERLRMGGLGDDQGKYNLARDAFKNQEFAETIKQAEGINPQGDLGQARDALIKEAGYYLAFEKARVANANSNYAKAESLIDELALQLSVEKLSEELVSFYEKVKSFATDIKKHQEKTVAFDEAFSKAKQTYALDFDQRLDALQFLLDEYSDRKALIDEIAKLEKELKKDLEEKIITFQKKMTGQKGAQLSAADYEEAHQALEASRTLEKRNLLQDENTLALAKWIRNTYPKLETEYFRSTGSWKELLAKIQEKYGDTPPFHIKAQINEAKRSKSVEEARRALKEVPPNAEKAHETLAKAVEENEQLVNDAEVAMLRSMVTLYKGDASGSANILRIAEQDQSQRKFTQQVRELLVQLKIIQQRQEEAERYLSDKDYGMLDSVLSNLDLIFEQLNSTISQPDAAQFLFYTREEYRKNRSVWSNAALNSLQKSLMDADNSVAEKVMLVFQIKKIDSTNPLIIKKLDNLSPDIPQAMKRLLRQVKEFYGSRKYASLPIAKGNSLFIEYENTLCAFEQIKILPDEMDEAESQTFKALVEAISKANEEKIFSQLEKTRQDLRDHQSSLQELADQLAPYLEYRALVSNRTSLVNASDENVCILYEQGRDQEGVVEEMQDSDIIGNFSENPDVNSFEDWRDQVSQDRARAFELIGEIKKGFNYGFGQRLIRGDDISLRVAKYLENYEAIIKAVKAIKGLTPQRHRNNSDETLGYEDIYHLDIEVEWSDDYLLKRIRGINTHYKLAAKRKDALGTYSEWYNNIITLSVPKEQDTNVILGGEFEDGLTDMVFDKHQYGVQQEVDYLVSALENYRKEYTEIIPKPKYDLLDDLGEELHRKGKKRILDLDKEEERISEVLEKIEGELLKLEGLQQDTARKLRPKKPAFSSIRKNLIEQHRLNPQDKAFPALLLTYQEKYRKSQKKGFSFFGR